MFGINFRREIAPIALPTLLGMLVFQIQNLTNRAFLGHLNVEYLSTISNVIFPLFTTVAMLNALATGATILMSQSLGANRKSDAQEYAAAAIKWNSALSLLLFVFWFFGAGLVFSLMGVEGNVRTYCIRYASVSAFSFLVTGFSGSLHAVFQASAKTKPLMYAGALRSLLNIVLDWFLIFGKAGFPELGLEGAALASVISDIAGAIFLVATLARSKEIDAKPKLRSILRAPFSLYKKIAGLGIPTSLEDLLWNVGNLALIRFLNMFDPLAAAVYALVFAMEIVPIVIFVTLGQTTTVLVGRAKGAENMPKARGATLAAVAAAWIASATIAIVLAAFPQKLIGIFTSDQTIILKAAPLLFISCINFFPKSANVIVGSGIRGLGDTRWMLFTQIGGTIFIAFTGYSLIVASAYGVLGLSIAMVIDETIRATVNSFRFFSKSRNDSGLRGTEQGNVGPAACSQAC